jgi:O-antigen/teichoic acid export membrane protein
VKTIFGSITARSLFKSFSVYTAANFINQAVPILLLPILTRVLSPYDYGVLATFMAVLAIVNILAGLGVPDAVVRAYFDQGKKDFDFAEYIFNAFIIISGIFVLLLSAAYISQDIFFKQFSIPGHYLMLIPVISFWTIFYNLPLKILVNMQRPLPFALLEISNTFIELVLSIFLVVYVGLNWQGRVLGIALDRLLFFILSIMVLYRMGLIKPKIKTAYLKQIFFYGCPIIVHSLGFVVTSTMDRFFLNRMVGVSETGIYSVGHSVAGIIGFLVGAFNLAWSPILFKRLGTSTKGLKEKLVKMTYMYFFIILSGALLLIRIAPVFVRLYVGKSFYGATGFVWWLALGYVAHGMYVMVVNYIFYEKKTYLLSIVALITVVLNVVFNYTLIRINGAVGAAQAVFLTFLSRFLLIWYFSNKVYPMPWFSFWKNKYPERDRE